MKRKIVSLVFALIFSSSGVFLSCKKDTEKPLPPNVTFTFTGDNNPAPCAVTFSNSTTNATSYVWNFGDGTPVSTEQNPQHIFTTGGVFNVILKGIGEGGSNTANKMVTIKFPPPQASFTFSGNNNPAPCQVTFINTSTNATSYSWNFGDGTTSSEENPEHNFFTGGNFEVSLLASGQGGSSSFTKTVIIPFANPQANFTFYGDNNPAPCLVHFENSSVNFSSCIWDFGDGESSTLLNPDHYFTYGGNFNVQLTVSGNGGTSTMTKIVTVLPSMNGTDITFYNPIFTDIHITLNGYSQTISPGGSVTFFSVPGSSVSYSAYTYGETTSGTQIGLELDWDYTITLPGGTISYNLVTSSDYFFLYMRNNGTHVLTPLYVNYGLSDQTIDYILIPDNNLKYKIGYYHAYTNTIVRAYYEDLPSSYTWWSNLNFPWTINQTIELTNTFNNPGLIDPKAPNDKTSTLLIPQTDVLKMKTINNKAVNVICR